MKSFERVSAILTSFNSCEPHLRIDQLLVRAGIPQSSGYKLIGDLIAEGLLRRVVRGTVALGPSAAELFNFPLRANMPARGGAVMSGIQIQPAPRKSRLETDLLSLVTTDRFRAEPPFTIGFANASTAHPWRMALERSLLGAARSQSDIVERLIVRNAENDPALQATQLLEMQEEGVDLCIISAASEKHDALEKSIGQLAGGKMPLVGVDRFCGNARDLVSRVTASDETVGRISALWLAERLGGVGKILMLCGLEHASPCRIRLVAALETFAEFPQIEIEAIEYTDWLAERGYEVIAGYLDSGRIPDGVWCDSGLQGVGSLSAFRDRGFRRGTIPPHTGGEMNMMYKIAVTEKVALCGLDYPAAMGAVSFQVALDILFGREVPRVVEADLQVVVTRGHETKSVRADIHAEKKVDWNSSDAHVHAAGRLRKRKAMQFFDEAPTVPRNAGAEREDRPHTDASRRLLDIAIVVAKKQVGTAYDIARTLALPMSSTYQAVNELERLSWLARDEDGNLLIGMVPQRIALAALGFEFAGNRLRAIVRFLRDQSGETAFAGSLGNLLIIGPHMVGFNPNAVRFAPFQVFPLATSGAPEIGTSALRLQCSGGRLDGNPAIHCLAIPLQASSPGFEKSQLVVGICWAGRKIDEARILAHLSEVEAQLKAVPTS